MKALPFVKPFFLNSDGTGAGAGYLLQTLEVGGEIDAITYKDPDGANANVNPIILDALGNFDLYYIGNLKLRYKTPEGATIWTLPNIEEISGGDGTLSIVKTMADLKALAAGEFPAVFLAGYYASGDKDARLYTWDGASTATNNNGTVVTPTGHVGAGRWLMEHQGEVSTLDFGMKGDNGATNDLTTLTAALLFVQANDLTLVAPPSILGLPYHLTTVSAQLAIAGAWKLKILPGASFNFVEAQVIGGIVEAGPHQWISNSSAATTFGPTARFVFGPIPEWWGAVGDGSGDQLLKINSWLGCGASVLFIVGNVNTDYECSAAPTIPAGIAIIAGGQVSEGLIVHIAQGIHGSAGSTAEFDQVIAVDVTASGIVSGNLLRSQTNVQAGLGGEGIVTQRVGDSVTDESPAVSTYHTQSTTGTTFSVTGAEADLMTRQLDLDSLKNPGDGIRINAGGDFNAVTAEGDTATLGIRIGPTALLTGMLINGDPSGGPGPTDWHFTGIIMVQGVYPNMTLVASGMFVTNRYPAGVTPDSRPGAGASAAYGFIPKDVSADHLLAMRGATAGGGTIRQKLFVLEYFKGR